MLNGVEVYDELVGRARAVKDGFHCVWVCVDVVEVGYCRALLLGWCVCVCVGGVCVDKCVCVCLGVCLSTT